MTEREPDQEPDGDEFPDPDTPPTGSAPGETGVTRQEHGGGQFAEAYEADPDLAGSSSIATPDENT